MSVDDAVRKHLAHAGEKHRELLKKMEDPEVASDHVRAGAVLREMGGFARFAELDGKLKSAEAGITEARELLELDEDEETRLLVESEIEDQEATVRRLLDAACDLMLSSDGHSGRNVIMEIRAGTGGDEAGLFAGDLFRMYTRFAEREHFKTEVLSVVPTALDGGLKEVVLSIKGKTAWAGLRFESGGHRVQRVPKTEAQGRIHTSLATVAVMPEAEEVDVDVRKDDLKIDFYRASGPGGQKVNKTSSAVRIVHLPTGIKVECQDEKSQHKNKARGMKILLSRIMDHHRMIADAERSDLRRSQIGSGDRNERIRTYNFPQSRVTDHRINLNLYNLTAVMDGDLEELFAQLAEYSREQRLQALAEQHD